MLFDKSKEAQRREFAVESRHPGKGKSFHWKPIGLIERRTADEVIDFIRGTLELNEQHVPSNGLIFVHRVTELPMQQLEIKFPK